MTSGMELIDLQTNLHAAWEEFLQNQKLLNAERI